MNEMEKLEEMKRFHFNEMAEKDRLIRTADLRAINTIKRNTRKTSDALAVIRTALQSAIKNRKTTITEMSNLLDWAEEAIENLKEVGIYTDPTEP